MYLVMDHGKELPRLIQAKKWISELLGGSFMIAFKNHFLKMFLRFEQSLIFLSYIKILKPKRNVMRFLCD